MKHLLLSLALLVAFISQAFAAAKGDKFTIEFNKPAVETPTGFFTYTTNYNTKFATTYNDIEFKNGLKMDADMSVSFVTAAKSKVTIVLSTWAGKNPTNKMTFDKEGYTAEQATETGDGYQVYVLNDVETGSHEIKRGSDEQGLLYVEVEYIETPKTILESTSISANEETGVVTLAAVEHADKIVYTLKSENDEVEHDYVEPFTLTDDETVTAWAVGSGEYVNSSKVSELIALFNKVLDKPTMVELNGSVAITTALPKTTIEYSLDEGATWNNYVGGLTFSENGVKVLGRAVRSAEGKFNYSETESVEVNSVIAQPEGTTTVFVYFDGAGSNPRNFNPSGLTANKIVASIVDAEGELLEKSYEAGDRIVLPVAGLQSTTKVSNGAINKVVLPKGWTAKRATIYSYVNKASEGARTSYWKEFNGATLTAIPFGAFNDTEYSDNPDVRVFSLTNEEGDGASSFTFTNTGEQVAFILALDVVAADLPAQFKVDVAEVEGGIASVIETAFEGAKVNITLVPNDGFVVDTVEISGVNGLEGDQIKKKVATFVMPSADVVVTAKFKAAEAPSAIRPVATDAEDAKTYNLYGVQVDSNYKGLVIRGGKKYLQKK